MNDPLAFTIVAAPLIVGVVAAIRQATPVDRTAGLLSLVLGVTFGLGWELGGPGDLGGEFLAVVHGLIAGLTASGLWSTSKASGEAVSSSSL